MRHLTPDTTKVRTFPSPLLRIQINDGIFCSQGMHHNKAVVIFKDILSVAKNPQKTKIIIKNKSVFFSTFIPNSNPTIILWDKWILFLFVLGDCDSHFRGNFCSVGCVQKRVSTAYLIMHFQQQGMKLISMEEWSTSQEPVFRGFPWGAPIYRYSW